MTRKLIERFFNNDCDDEERQRVITFLGSDPQLFDEYLSENEWNNFIQKERLDPIISERIYSKINRQTNSKSRIVSMMKLFAIAASIILITGLGWKYLLKEEITRDFAKNNTFNTEIIDTTNNSNSLVEFSLPDNSLVELMPGSSLKYTKLFSEKKRVVYLSGEAVFKVAKDSTKPFVVISDEVSTTALGTVFRVIALNHERKIHVKLYEGKVVIRKNNDDNKNLEKDYYLTPGEQFEFDKRTNQVTTFNFNNNKLTGNDPTLKVKKAHAVSSNESGNWYMFDNQNLTDVFENLESIYNVKIEFNRQSIQKINFIGKIDKQDSIELILRDVARINGLTVNRKRNTFYITKK